MLETQLTSVVDISNSFSHNIYSYVIFISMTFLICFLFLGWQLLTIFKGLLQKVLEDVLLKLDKIEREVENLKDRIK